MFWACVLFMLIQSPCALTNDGMIFHVLTKKIYLTGIVALTNQWGYLVFHFYFFYKNIELQRQVPNQNYQFF